MIKNMRDKRILLDHIKVRIEEQILSLVLIQLIQINVLLERFKMSSHLVEPHTRLMANSLPHARIALKASQLGPPHPQIVLPRS